MLLLLWPVCVLPPDDDLGEEVPVECVREGGEPPLCPPWVRPDPEPGWLEDPPELAPAAWWYGDIMLWFTLCRSQKVEIVFRSFENSRDFSEKHMANVFV